MCACAGQPAAAATPASSQAPRPRQQTQPLQGEAAQQLPGGSGGGGQLVTPGFTALPPGMRTGPASHVFGNLRTLQPPVPQAPSTPLAFGSGSGSAPPQWPPAAPGADAGGVPAAGALLSPSRRRQRRSPAALAAVPERCSGRRRRRSPAAFSQSASARRAATAGGSAASAAVGVAAAVGAAAGSASGCALRRGVGPSECPGRGDQTLELGNDGRGHVQVSSDQLVQIKGCRI